MADENDYSIIQRKRKRRRIAAFKSYPDSVQFLHENTSISINCSYFPIARTNWREYVSCKHLPTARRASWRPASTCAVVGNDVITLTVNDEDSDAIIPGFAETYYYISETKCVSQNVKIVIHRCDPEAPKCNKCTLPLGIEDGRIPASQISGLSSSSDGSLSRPRYKWCAGILDDKQFLEVDLGYERVITGVGASKNDTIEEFMLRYKKERSNMWHFYKQGGNAKLFQVNHKSKSVFSRHWFAHKVRARYLRFHITRWRVALCFHVEVYGCDDGIAFEKYVTKRQKSRGKSNAQTARKISKGHGKIQDFASNIAVFAKNGKTTGVITTVNDTKKILKEVGKNTMISKDSASNDKHDRKDTLIICFVASGIIAVVALIIVCQWDRMERKIRPDYLKIRQ